MLLLSVLIIMSPQNRKHRKDSNNESDHEEPKVTDDKVVKEPSYVNIFEFGKRLLIKIDAMCKRECMITPRDKYHT